MLLHTISLLFHNFNVSPVEKHKGSASFKMCSHVRIPFPNQVLRLHNDVVWWTTGHDSSAEPFVSKVCLHFGWTLNSVNIIDIWRKTNQKLSGKYLEEDWCQTGFCSAVYHLFVVEPLMERINAGLELPGSLWWHNTDLMWHQQFDSSMGFNFHFFCEICAFWILFFSRS